MKAASPDQQLEKSAPLKLRPRACPGGEQLMLGGQREKPFPAVVWVSLGPALHCGSRWRCLNFPSKKSKTGSSLVV